MHKLAFHTISKQCFADNEESIKSIEGLDLNKKMYLAESTITSAEILAMLANETHSGILEKVAENTSTPPEALTKLADHAFKYIRLYVASNPSTPIEALMLLTRDSDYNVRQTIASNSTTPVEILNILAKDRDANVRYSTAANDNTPPETIALLARDVDDYVRDAVACNPLTSTDALAVLAEDVSPTVRGSVAHNPSTSTETLTMLTRDPSVVVKQYANIFLYKRLPVQLSEPLSKQEMRDKGFAGKESFDHKSTKALDKAVPGYTLDAQGQDWVKYIYADDAGNEFPAELFQAFNLSHKGDKLPLGNGKPLGWIGGKYDAKTKTLYITEMQSDLLQRTYELNDPRLAKFKPYKSRLENRFSGWYYVFMNQAMRYAKELGVSKVALPTAQAYTSHVSGAKNIAGIYEKVLANYQHVNKGKWNVIEMAGVQKLARRVNLCNG